MKRSKLDARKKLELRKESLRRLESPALEQVAGGKPPQAVAVVNFDLAAYLRTCMGTGY